MGELEFFALLEKIFIPLLMFVLCLYYGIRVMFFKEIGAIRGKTQGPVKDKEAYCKKGGQLILFYSVASLIMAGLMLVNLYAAVAEIVICTLIFGVLWQKMNEKYGA